MISLPEPEKNIVIVTGPSGSGKDTLINRALETLAFEKIVTTTSRPKRASERDGREHYFISTPEFQKRIKEGKFFEYSQNENGAYYGVEEVHLIDAARRNKKLIWRVDWKGVNNIKKIFPGLKSIAIMAAPETLERRLRTREGKNVDEKYFQERLSYGQDYFTRLSDYDYVIWNEDDHLAESVGQFKELVTKITSA